MERDTTKYQKKPRLSPQEWKNQQFQKVLDRQKYSKKRQSFFVLQRKLIKIIATVVVLVAIVLPIFGVLEMMMSIGGGAVILLVLAFAYMSALIQEKSLRKMLTSSDSLDKLYSLNPFDFEEAVAEMFRKHGFQHVEVTPSRLDGGVDIVMEKDGKRYGVQCKKYDPDSYIKIEIAKALLPSCQRLGLAQAVFVTTAKFSDHTRSYMATEPMWLIDGAALVHMMQSHA